MTKITRKQLTQAIRTCRGNHSAIGRKLKVSRQAVAQRIASDEQLSKLCAEQREVLLDSAEYGLALAVKKRSAWAIRFVLATLGRARGFTKTLSVEAHDTGGRVILYLPENGREIPDELKGKGLNLIVPSDGRDTSLKTTESQTNESTQ